MKTQKELGWVILASFVITLLLFFATTTKEANMGRYSCQCSNAHFWWLKN